MQAQGSQQVSLLTTRPSPGTAGSVRAYAGVAQLVEHLFCKQVVSGSIPLASSTSSLLSSVSSVTKTSEGCPSGQREQAVNLPAHAYVGSNPTPSTNNTQARTAREHGQGMPRPRRGFDGTVVSAGVTQLVESQFSKLNVVRRRELSSRPAEVNSAGPHPQFLGPQPQNSRHFEATFVSAGVTQLVESQFSKLKVDGSSPFSRSNFLSASRLSLPRAQQQTRPASLVAGEALASTGAERTPVREHRSATKAQPPAKIASRPSASHQTTSRTVKQTRCASLVAGEVEARTGAERTLVREHRTAAKTQPPAKIARRAASQVTASAHLAQLVEHVLGKDEVTSSSLVVGSNLQP